MLDEKATTSQGISRTRRLRRVARCARGYLCAAFLVTLVACGPSTPHVQVRRPVKLIPSRVEPPELLAVTGLTMAGGVLALEGSYVPPPPPAPPAPLPVTQPVTPAPVQVQSWPTSLQPCGGDLPPCYVKQRESGGDYSARNNSEPGAAAGAWQIIGSTWAGFDGYAEADQAPPAVQDEKARELWDGGAGCSHWSACA